MADRYVTPEELPTPHQCEVLAILIEECAEVIQRATKMLRFGIEETQPGQEYTNRERLGHEVGDVSEMIDMACRAGLMTNLDICVGRSRKRRQLEVYMQTEEETGHD